jgi:ABC-type amino acid transport substrate-binding protein
MQQALDTLHNGLQQLRSGQLDAHGFSQLARAQTALLQALPPRYGEVLRDLLTRLESSALFSEESCSFSQSALVDNLQVWIDKARAQLG